MERIAGQFCRVEPPASRQAVGAPNCWRTCRARTAGRSPSTPGTPPRRPAAPARPRQMGRRPRPGRPAGVRAGARGRRPGRAGDGRDWRSEEGHPHRRRPAPVHRHRRADRERQVAVYLTYTSRHGHAVVDRALYLPKSWTSDLDRCGEAAVPDDVGFATKAQLARQMIEPPWTRELRPHGRPATRSMATTRTCAPPWSGGSSATCSRSPAPTASPPRSEDSAPTTWPRRPQAGLTEAVRRTRCEGAPLVRLGPDRHHRPGLGRHQHLLIRRNRRTGELAYYRCYAPRPVPLSTIVKVAGSRWTVEETFQNSKTLAGLDEHQVRRWDSGTAGSPWPCSPTPSSRSRPPSNAATKPWPTQPLPTPGRPSTMKITSTAGVPAHLD